MRNFTSVLTLFMHKCPISPKWMKLLSNRQIMCKVCDIIQLHLKFIVNVTESKQDHSSQLMPWWSDQQSCNNQEQSCFIQTTATNGNLHSIKRILQRCVQNFSSLLKELVVIKSTQRKEFMEVQSVEARPQDRHRN